MRKIISAIHDAGPDDRQVLTIVLRQTDDKRLDFDAQSAVKSAVSDFLKTARGKEALKETNGSFNYGDFVNFVPDTICKRHGFTVEDVITSDIVTEHDESLLPDGDGEPS